MSLLIGILTFVLILFSVFLVLLVLVQKSKGDTGLGAALGGGVAESTFGAETGNVLTKATIMTAVGFFVLSFLLYLGHIYQRTQRGGAGDELPKFSAPAATPAAVPAPATETPAAPVLSPAPADSAAQPTPAPVEPAPQPKG